MVHIRLLILTISQLHSGCHLGLFTWFLDVLLLRQSATDWSSWRWIEDSRDKLFLHGSKHSAFKVHCPFLQHSARRCLSVYNHPCSVFISDALFSDQLFPCSCFYACSLASLEALDCFALSTMTETLHYNQRRACDIVMMGGCRSDVEELFVVPSWDRVAQSPSIRGRTLMDVSSSSLICEN